MTSKSQAECKHCGTPFSRSNEEEKFCCPGCRFVNSLIDQEGLNRYYELKGKQVAGPVSSIVFQDEEFEWLQREVAAAEETTMDGDTAKLDLRVSGISCVACVWLIESVFLRHDGAVRVEIDAQGGRVRLHWMPGSFNPAEFAGDLRRFGYELGAHDASAPVGESRALMLKMGLCGAFAMNGMAFSFTRYLGMDDSFFLADLFDLIVVLSATLALLTGGGYFFQRAWCGLRAGRLHIDAPISLGILFAYGGSLAGWALGIPGLLYFDFVAVFIFLMLLGRWVQQKAVEKNRSSLASAQKASDVDLVGDDGTVLRAQSLDQIERGSVIELTPGRMLPVMSRLIDGEGEFSLETITGEPEAQWRGRGSELPAGVVYLGRTPLRVEAGERFEGSLLAQLLAESKGYQARNHLFERVLQWYLGVVLVLALGGGIYHGVAGAGLGGALQVFISVLVVSCPCALGVALPLIDETAVSVMRRFGLFVRGHELWARLSRVRKVILDKTGTITLESPQLMNPEALESLNSVQQSRLMQIVRDSRHPLSRALREQLECPQPDGSEIEEVPGKGVRLTDATGDVWSLGRPGWMGEGDWSGGSNEGPEAHFCVNGDQIVAFQFREAVRRDAQTFLDRLRHSGLKLTILSGDQPERVRALAATLGISESDAIGGLTPQQKAERVEALGGDDALYLGDGANDSLAFDHALCTGTPASGGAMLEKKSDFYFLGRSLRPVGILLDVARQRQVTVRHVFVFAIAYNIGAVGLCLAGKMSPLLAAILMPFSSLALLALVALRRPKVR